MTPTETNDRKWHSLQAYTIIGKRELLALYSAAKAGSYETYPPLWLSGQVHISVFASDAELDALCVKAADDPRWPA